MEREARESTRLLGVQTRVASHQERMELIEAVKKQDVEKVEVRRLLEAFLGAEYGPSRGVCLGLGQWTLDAVVARPIRPCRIQPLRQAPLCRISLLRQAPLRQL